MHRSLSALVLAALLGCGGSNGGAGNTSDPATACKNLFTTLCNKLFQCNASGAAQIYGSASACASNLGAGCSTGNASCPSGTSYSSGNASTCINDYGSESCSDIMSGVTPASCNHVCQ